MTIKPGPTVEKFASLTGATVAEVVEWMSDYIKHPPAHAEPTIAEREESIKAYVIWRCETYPLRYNRL